MINLLEEVVALDADGTVINTKEGKPPTLKEICLFALRAAHQSDQATSFKAKNERYLLAKRMDELNEIELTKAEVEMVTNRIGNLYLQIGIVGRAAELLNADPA